MIDLESKVEILGVTVFTNADNPLAHSYLAGTPHISRDAGGPMFDLFAFRKGGTATEAYAGGFLTMTVDTSLGDLYDRVLGVLKSQKGEGVTLAPVPYSKGTVRLIALDADATVSGRPKFVESVMGAGAPTLDDKNQAIFSVTLSEDGTSFFLGVLKGDANARPVGVVYELEYVGLLPAYSVEITIDMKSSYSYLGTRTSLNSLFLKADIETAVEELKKRNAITVKETVRTLELSTADAMADRLKTINNLVTTLCTGALFQQTLNPGSPLVNGQGLMTVANQPSGSGQHPGTTTGTTTTTPTVTTTTTGTTAPVTTPPVTTTTRPPVTGNTPPVTTTPVFTPPVTGPGPGALPPPRDPESGEAPPPAGEGETPVVPPPGGSTQVTPPGGGEGAPVTPPPGGGEGAPVTPPPGGGEGAPVTPPPGGGEGAPVTPPPGGGEGAPVTPPPGNTPPVTGNTPPVTGNTPPVTGNTPPVTGNTPPVTGNTPPVTGNTPPVTGNTPPVTGNTPPVTGNTPPVTGNTPPVTGNTPPVTGNTPPTTGTTDPNKPSGAEKAWNDMGRPQAAFAMRMVSQEEQKVITYNLDQVTAQKQLVNPQSMLQFLTAPSELVSRIHVIDLNNEFFQRIKIRVDAADVDFAAEGVSQLTVEIRYGVRQDGTGPKDNPSVILRSDTDLQDLVLFVDHTGSLTYQYRLIVDYKEGFGVGVRQTHVEGDWTNSELRTLSVHPSWLGVMVPARLQLVPNTPEDVLEVQVNARYRSSDGTVDDGEQVSLTRQNRTALLPLRLKKAGDPVSFTSTVFYTDGSNEVLPAQTLPNDQATDALAIGVPPAGRINGDILLVDALGELTKVIVDYEVRQGTSLIESKSVELSGGATRQQFSVRLPNRNAPGGLRWRQRLVYADGGVETQEWKDAATPNLVAGIPSEGVLTVNIRYVGALPSASGLAVVVVQLGYADPGGDTAFAQQDSLIIDDTPASQLQEWRARLKDRDAREFTWSMTTMAADGTQQVGPTVTTTNPKVLVMPPARAGVPVPTGGPVLSPVSPGGGL